MINDNYLAALAKSSSLDEFILRFVIETGLDLRDDNLISLYEDDYRKRINDNFIYKREFIKDGKISFEDALSSKLPILVSYNIEIDDTTFSKVAVTKVYDKNAKVQEIRWNLDLDEDLQAMYGIDADAMMNQTIKYELERMK